MADVTVQSLLNTAKYDSYTGLTLATKTVDQLKADIQTATGVNVAWFDLVLNEQVLTGTDTLTAAGVSDGDAIRTHNKIGAITLKRDRQDAKLALANLSRAYTNTTDSGRYTDTTSDATQLPTRYNASSNTGTLVDNPNTGGLKEGRPWAS